MRTRNRNMLRKGLTLAVIVSFVALVVSSCVREKPLPILGERDFNGADTAYHTIRNFSFLNQDSSLVTNETVKDKIYVADFFFTSCRTICPIMKTQMLRVYEATKDDEEVLILSHTIDPEFDTVGLLRDYARRLGVSSPKWHFLTGNKDDVYAIAEKSYFATAREDKTEPDGFIHSGAFILVDKAQRIRGVYDGTKQDEVDRLIRDIERLQREYETAG